MHGDYGHAATVEHATGKGTVPGLAGLFRDEVVVVTLDPQRAGGPHVRADLYADDVEPEDLLGMTDTLNLTANAADTARLVRRKYKTRWLATLLRADDLAALAEETTANQASLEALKRRLSRFEEYPFFHLDTPAGARDGLVDAVVEPLLQRRSIVFQFGRYDHLAVYLLAANLVSRRVRAEWESRDGEEQGRIGRGAAAARHHDRGGAQIPRPRHRARNALRNDRARDAQVQRLASSWWISARAPSTTRC